MVFIDLDNFKIINDTLGHDVGDVLLTEAARRLKACVRQEDTVCRLGGDEFTVYVEDFSDPESLVGTAQRLAQTISEPYHISGQDIFVTASVGISVYPNDGTTMSELIKNADTAMYKVKEQGKNGFQFFREDMNARAFERLVFVSGLRRALERQEFRVVYQPQIDLAGGAACWGGVPAPLGSSRYGRGLAGGIYPGCGGDGAHRSDRGVGVRASVQATTRVGRPSLARAHFGERLGASVPPAGTHRRDPADRARNRRESGRPSASRSPRAR